MPQLQRRSLPHRENDSRNHALDYRNYTRLHALLYVPVRYLVDEESFACTIRKLQENTSRLARFTAVTITAFIYIPSHLSIFFTPYKKDLALLAEGIYGACLQSFLGHMGHLVFWEFYVRGLIGKWKDSVCVAWNETAI
jgi:hypothetical protein